MSEQSVIDVLVTAFTVTLKLAAPLLLVSLGVGLIISIFQAATQIHEQTLTFVPKLIVIGILLIVLAPWMMTITRDFVITHFEKMLSLI